MLKFKKVIIMASVLASVLAPSALSSNAYYGSTDGGLNISKHYVPILKDTASGWTYTNYGYEDTNWDLDRLWASTYVTAYNKDSYTTASAYGTGSAALEGWYNAVAKIRNIQSAYGTHSGGSTNKCSQTKYSSWSK